MKKLILMRHGKSSWKDEHLTDFERPLKKRGQHDVILMAKLLKQEKLIPGLILSSPAMRCRETVLLANEVFGLPEEAIVWDDNLYMADEEDYLAALKTLPKDEKIVLICGHNPTMESLMQSMTGTIDVMSTAGVAYIKLDLEAWGDIDEEVDGRLKALWRPKEINE
ncbi:MAG: histidine phosphatase family protein [Anaerolineae bacterium]|jgi:phosphohistidine phosphatase|nr:histidine phosphatase family protein [Anaerolineae bacterium]